MAVEVEADGTFKAGTPKLLFQRESFLSESMGSTGISWDNHPDDKRFLVIKSALASGDESVSGLPRKINIVLNWFEELKDRVPLP